VGIALTALFFVLGTVVGSFVNAAVYRIRHKLPLGRARSHCPHCKHQLAAQDLIPILSFLLLKGKCRYCGKPISLQYPTVELLTGLLFAGNFVYFFGLAASLHPAYGDIVSFAVRLIFITILMILFWYDLLYMEIPDRVVLPGIIIALLGNIAVVAVSFWDFWNLTAKLPIGKYLLARSDFWQGHLWDLTSPYVYGLGLGLGLAVIFYLIVLLSRERAMGGGDIKLAVLLGLILPWPYLIPALYSGFLIGALVGLGLVLSSRGKMRTLIPLAPFLIAGVFAAMFFGADLLSLMIIFKPF
jgi:leader peptidase (prepilin peptidase)/N-methyltransferase